MLLLFYFLEQLLHDISPILNILLSFQCLNYLQSLDNFSMLSLQFLNFGCLLIYSLFYFLGLLIYDISPILNILVSFQCLNYLQSLDNFSMLYLQFLIFWWLFNASVVLFPRTTSPRHLSNS